MRTILFRSFIIVAVCVLSAPFALLGRARVTIAQQEPAQNPSSVIAELFTFEVKECRKIGDRVICEALVTNKGDERSLSIRGKQWGRSDDVTRLIDDLGNVYDDAKGQFGTKELPYAAVTLVTDVPVRLILYFDGVAKEASRIRLLELDCYTDDGDKAFRVQLRDIPLKIPALINPSRPDATANPNSITTREYTFEALPCRRSLNEVTCSFRVTNEQAASRTLGLRARCHGDRPRLIDQLGNEYLATGGSLGTKKPTPDLICESRQTIDSRASLNGSVTFTRVPADARQVKLLRLRFVSLEATVGFDIDFRDIPINAK